MFMSTILVPLDGSALAERALPLASQLAHATGDQLRLERSYTLPPVADGVIPPTNQLEDDARDYLAGQVEPLRREEGVNATVVTEFAPPAFGILNEAEAQDVAYVVMTTHGREGVSRVW